MNNIWAVARHTFSQCLRMKIAVAFLLLLGGALAILPFIMQGDGTLAGSIRTCLNYSVSITGVLLSIVTVLVTVSVVSGDIKDKHIMMLAVKPLARWQYMLGRWLGVVLLNAVLLTIAAISIFLVVQHLRGKEATSPLDRRAVETEIFTARQEVRPEVPDYQAKLLARINELRKTNRYNAILKEFQDKNGGSLEDATLMLQKELFKQIKGEFEIVGPRGTLAWQFKGFKLKEQPLEGKGRVEEIMYTRTGQMFRIGVSPSLANRLFEGGPVQVQGIRGRVMRLDTDKVTVRFRPSDEQRQEITSLAKDQDVDLVAEPTIQFRYKVKPIGDLPSSQSTVHRALAFKKTLSSPVILYLGGDTPVKTATTVTIPALKALRDGELVVVYANIPKRPTGPMMYVPKPVPVQVAFKDVSILYRVGDFEGNFFRAILLVFCQLIFLAALGVFFGSFLSFPVAAMACLVLLGSGWMVDWLADAVSWAKASDAIGYMGSLVLGLVQLIMPNLGKTAPAEKLVDGLYISWSTLGNVTLMTVAVRTVFYLAVGCLIFHRRELAKVQV